MNFLEGNAFGQAVLLISSLTHSLSPRIVHYVTLNLVLLSDRRRKLEEGKAHDLRVEKPKTAKKKVVKY